MPRDMFALIKSKGFDLTKYEPSKHWTNTEWLSALCLRESAGYFRYLGAGSTKHRRDIASRREKAESLINAPLAYGGSVSDDPPISDQTALEFFDGVGAVNKDAGYGAWLHALLNNFYDDIDDVPEFLGVTSNRLIDIEQEVELIPAWKMHSELEGRWQKELKELDQWDHSHWRHTPWKPFIKVNMLLSDHILVEAFKAWLRDARVKLNFEYPVKNIRKPDIKTWYAKRYLPILDLKFWAEVNGVKLSFEDLAELVFPNMVDAEGQEGVDVDNVRKTLFPNALQLLSPSALRSLEYLFHQTCQEE